MYKSRFIIIILFCVATINSFGKIPLLFGKKIELIDTFETKNCFISYVMMNGNKYLVKQKKESNKQISVVRDALAAYIAKDLKIAHEVDIIACKEYFPGKIQKIWPATIHTIAPGDTVRKQRASIYNLLRIKQQWALAQTFEEMGLTRNIIAQMTWHWQLPIIIALDIFIGNSDRHCGNLCYDPDTDRFCAIDMDDTFNKDLCAIACRKLESMIYASSIHFTTQEIAALMRMRKTLLFLLNKYSVKHLVKKLYYFAKKAGFVPGCKSYTPSIKKKLDCYESMIKSSWKNGLKLIVVLDKIIDSHKKSIEVDNGEIDGIPYV